MFVVSEADAAAIHAAYRREGELSAALELRRRFPSIPDDAKALECARRIVDCTPVAGRPAPLPPKKGGWPRVSADVRDERDRRVTELHQDGVLYTDIAQRLELELGTVHGIIVRLQRAGTLARRAPDHRFPRSR